MRATLAVLDSAGAELDIDVVEIGDKVYRRGIDTGLDPKVWDSIARTKVLLKAPITTPQGGGYKSLNVTLRTALNLFANVRPTIAYAPYVETKYPDMDVVIVRENEEDLYTGIEHRQTEEVYQCLKLISQPGSERVIRYAFDYARANNRRKVSCFIKDNIMKMTDGVFHRTFDRIAEEYPDLEHDAWIVDIGAAKLATTPESFDVVVMPNLYGDILSDVTAETSGSVGIAGSANIGEHYAMFEAIHGSAPGLAGQNIANPSGLILAAVMMLVHIGQADVASRIHNAWLRTLEDGLHTPDIYRPNGISQKRVTTEEFALAVQQRLGARPEHLSPVNYSNVVKTSVSAATTTKKSVKQLVGIDVFLDWTKGQSEDLANALKALCTDALSLQAITNRGIKVWPKGISEAFCTDHWRCRFQADGSHAALNYRDLMTLQAGISEAGFDIVKTENLYTFDGIDGFSAIAG